MTNYVFGIVLFKDLAVVETLLGEGGELRRLHVELGGGAAHADDGFAGGYGVEVEGVAAARGVEGYHGECGVVGTVGHVESQSFGGAGLVDLYLTFGNEEGVGGREDALPAPSNTTHVSAVVPAPAKAEHQHADTKAQNPAPDTPVKSASKAARCPFSAVYPNSASKTSTE